MRPRGLKRWSTDRRGWWRLRRSATRIVRHGDVVLVLLEALEVIEPLWVTCAGERVRILDDGYAWLFICRAGARHVVTAHCDERGRPVHWYIDVVERWMLGAEGYPTYDDLFLDVVATPGGAVEVRDADEFEAARGEGVVTQAQYDLAWSEAERVVRELWEGTFESVARTPEYLEVVRSARTIA